MCANGTAAPPTPRERRASRQSIKRRGPLSRIGAVPESSQDGGWGSHRAPHATGGPDDSARRYLVRDRDSIYGGEFRRRVEGIGLVEVLTAPRSPWQNPLAERMIGSRALRKLDDCFQEDIDFDGLGQMHLKPCIQCSLPIVLAGERSQRDGGDLFPSVAAESLHFSDEAVSVFAGHRDVAQDDLRPELPESGHALSRRCSPPHICSRPVEHLLDR